MGEPERPVWRPTFQDGLALAVLLVCVIVAERLDVARATVASVRDAGGSATTVASARPTLVLWMATGVIGVAVAWWMIDRVGQEATALGFKPGELETFRDLALAAVVAWGLWVLVGAIATFGDLPAGVGTAGLVLHVVALGLALVALGSAARVLGDPALGWKRAGIVRLQIIVAGALIVLVFLVPLTAAQIAEVFRAWGDGPFTRAVNGVAAALLLGAVLRASTMRFLAPDDPEETPDPNWSRRYTVLATAVVAIPLVALHAWVGLIALAGVLVVAWLTEWEPPMVASVDEQIGEKRLAALLGIVPLGIVLAGLASATFDSFLLPASGDPADFRLLFFTLIVGVLFAWLAPHAQNEVDARWDLPRGVMFLLGFAAGLAAALLPRELNGMLDFLWAMPLLAFAFLLACRVFKRRRRPTLWAGGGVAVAVVVAVYLDPVGAPRGLGTFGVAMIGTTALLLLLHAAGAAATRRKPRWERRFVPRRVPVVTLLAIWVGVAAFWPAENVDTFHQARTAQTRGLTGSVDGAVRAWLARQDAGSQDYVPMLVVGASGGGGKAAFWTDLVIDCALGDGSPSEDTKDECAPSGQDGARFRRLFMTSSVSGGSVGVYHLLTQQPSVESGIEWVDRAAGREVLSPITAWGLFHDLPTFMLRMPTDPRDCDGKVACRRHADRALVQEAAVADFHQDIVPPVTGRRLIDRSPGPVPVFNGALNGGEGRVLMSPLALAPPRPEEPGCYTRQVAEPPEPAGGSLDGHDVLRREGAVRGPDLPLVTAALLSARFPVVAPAARLGDFERDETPRCNAPLPLPPVIVRDGGYVENTGLLTITELLPAIRSALDAAKPAGLHVQIVVLSIDDDPSVLDANPELTERGGPGLGISQTAGPSYLSRLARDRLTSCQYPDVTYLRVSPPPHAGAQAATGWEVSRTARQKDLGVALEPGSPAMGQVEKLRAVLDGRLQPRGCGRP